MLFTYMTYSAYELYVALLDALISVAVALSVVRKGRSLLFQTCPSRSCPGPQATCIVQVACIMPCDVCCWLHN